LYRNLVIENDVFVGPGVCFMNDPNPRANRIRSLRGKSWRVKQGASIGANASIGSDVNIGRHAMIGAGSLVSRDVPDHILAYGVPARWVNFVDPDGEKLQYAGSRARNINLKSENGKFRISVKSELYNEVKG